MIVTIRWQENYEKNLSGGPKKTNPIKAKCSGFRELGLVAEGCFEKTKPISRELRGLTLLW